MNRRRTDGGIWEGWEYTTAGLIEPNGNIWTPRDLERWHWDRQRLRLLEQMERAPAQYLMEF
jgi:hypothetical protein